MTPAARRSLVTAALCGLLVSGQIVVVSLPTTATSRTSCSALRDWAAPYRNISPTLDDLARFDRAHRLAVFNAVSPEVRAALWQDQLHRFGRHSDLTATQHRLIEQAMALATPALYRHDSAASDAVDVLWGEADTLFTPREQRRLWFDLGAVVPVRSHTSLWDRISRPFQLNAQGDFCQCNTAYGPLECGSAGCFLGGCDQWVGCGPIGNKVCNGVCGS